MVQDPHLKEVFPKPPLVAYKRQKNIRQTLIRARVPKIPTRPKRKIQGMKKCNRCVYCSYVLTGDHAKATASDYHHQITDEVTCNSSNIIYLIDCQKGKMQYVGETDRRRRMKDRFSEHQGYVRNKDLKKATGQHFNLAGHRLSDMRIRVLEKIHNKDPFYRKKREAMYINKFNTKLKGLNKIS